MFSKSGAASMAYPNSPEVGLEGSSGLDRLIKNTEFENIQHTKAIETERERIKAYKSQLEEKKQQTVELDNSTVSLDEQTMKLHKQFAFNQENFESLKHTSTVLGDHEDTLRRKVSTLQTNVEQEHSEQSNALSKYEGIWASYKAKYESKEKVRLLRSKEEHLHTVREHNAQLEKQILQLEQTIQAMKQNQGRNSSLVSWVLQIAALRCETHHHLKSICAEMALAGALRLEVSELKGKTLETQSLLEKREMEANLATQQQAETEKRVHMDDVAAMEINANTISKDFQAPNFEHPPGLMTSAGFVPMPLSLQSPTFANTSTTANNSTQQQQLVANNTTTQRGQQKKKASRFLLEMPQLSMPRPRPVTNSTPANLQAQLSITRLNFEQPQQHTVSPQSTAKTNQRRVAQLQMPSLHTPSRPKPLATSASVHHAATIVTSSNQGQNTSLTVSKPSLQRSMPAQAEQSRPTIHQAMNKNATHVQSPPGSANAAPHTSQQPVGPLSPKTVENDIVASQQDDASDSNTNTTNMSQEMQIGTASEPQNTSSVINVNIEGESLGSDEINEANRAKGSSDPVFSATDVQIQQPLQPTTPTQQAATATASDMNTTTIAVDTVEMADPPITTYADPTITTFNQAAQQMDTASTTSSQDPVATSAASEGYSMYGAEVYQQPSQQMQMGNAMAGQFFDGGMNAFGQSDGFGGIFGGAGSSSFDGGSFFGGPPATPQQQQPDTGGFDIGFSFGGSSTPTSSSSMFSFF